MGFYSVFLFLNIKNRIQFMVQLFMIFTILSIFSHTFLFKYGLIKMICSKFKITFIVIFIYPFLFILERLIRVVNYCSKIFKYLNQVYVSDTLALQNNDVSIWAAPYYIAMYVLKFIFAFLFYTVIINTSFELGKSKYYKADPMFGFRQSQ